jgi:hypothetical protein
MRNSTGGLLIAVLAAAPPALGQDALEDPDSGLGELSLNAGFTLPLGNAINSNNAATSGVAMSDAINFAIPFGIEVGYRIAGVVFVGGTFSYGAFGSPNSSVITSCGSPGASCHSNFVRAGFSVEWHFLGSRGSDPYVGLGANFEWLNVSASANNINASVQYTGFNFAEIPIGWDFRLGRNARFGPFANFAIGKYYRGSLTSNASIGIDTGSVNIPEKALHFWIGFGIRVVFLSN